MTVMTVNRAVRRSNFTVFRAEVSKKMGKHTNIMKITFTKELGHSPLFKHSHSAAQQPYSWLAAAPPIF